MIQRPSIANLPLDFVREEKVGWLTAAVEWGFPRCGSDAARALFPPMAALLGEFNATILPLSRGEGVPPLVDLRITLSRPLSSGKAQRIRFAVVSDDSAKASESTAPGDTPLILLRVEPARCLSNAWEVAGELVGRMLGLASGG